MKAPLDPCNRNNIDFGGDKSRLYILMSMDAVIETQAAWIRMWGSYADKIMDKRLITIVRSNEGSINIDPAMYTAIPLKDIIDHPGRKMYNLLMLKTGSWKVMEGTTISVGY